MKPSKIRWIALSLLACVLSFGLAVVLVLPGLPPPRGNNIRCESMEGEALHFHIHLQLWNQEQRLEIPANVGSPGPCYYWIHTHSPDGIIHIEAPQKRSFLLGEVFDVWGVNPFHKGLSIFEEENLRLWVKKSGEPEFLEILTNWSQYVLEEHDLLSLQIGTQPALGFTFPKDL